MPPSSPTSCSRSTIRRRRWSAGRTSKTRASSCSTNPFAADYAWGKSEIVEYKNERGERLQGALFYPAGYEPGRKYPMVVYMYERLSDGLHRWSSPSDREPYNPAVFTSLGYMFLQPDIVFRPREPGLSVADCVGAAVKRVIAMGAVDPAKIGIIGHSWGGFDTVFLATHTNLFAAGVAGAPITDLVSNYGNHHWSAGIAETDHIETGQQRMEVPIWEDLPAYIRNSAVFGVSTMKTPLLVAFGDNDGTVHWHQGVELYNIARRAKKDVVHARLRRRGSQQPPEAEPARLSAPDRPVVRPLPEGRAGAAMDHERRQLSRSRAGAEEGQVRKGILMGGADEQRPFLYAWREVWRRDPQTALYGSDDFHPSALGSYLAALTVWRALSGASVVGLPGPSSISSSMLPLLQVAADRATAVSGSATRSGGPR